MSPKGTATKTTCLTLRDTKWFEYVHVKMNYGCFWCRKPHKHQMWTNEHMGPLTRASVWLIRLCLQLITKLSLNKVKWLIFYEEMGGLFQMARARMNDRVPFKVPPSFTRSWWCYSLFRQFIWAHQNTLAWSESDSGTSVLMTHCKISGNYSVIGNGWCFLESFLVAI